MAVPFILFVKNLKLLNVEEIRVLKISVAASVELIGNVCQWVSPVAEGQMGKRVRHHHPEPLVGVSISKGGVTTK